MYIIKNIKRIKVCTEYIQENISYDLVGRSSEVLDQKNQEIYFNLTELVTV